MGEVLVKPWTTGVCHECGGSFTLTRGDAETMDDEGEMLCGECRRYIDGVLDGKRAAADLIVAAVTDARQTGVEELNLLADRIIWLERVAGAAAELRPALVEGRWDLGVLDTRARCLLRVLKERLSEGDPIQLAKEAADARR